MLEATAISTEDGILEIEPQGDGSLKLAVKPSCEGFFVNRHTIVTRYPEELVRHILTTKGLGYVCDEIARDEAPKYIGWDLETGMFGFVGKEEFAGKRLLDFGCGSGGSTMNIHRLLPDTEIVGVELEPQLLSIAKARARHYGYPADSIRQSPSGSELPADIGDFDYIVMHAVYEHLLPDERDTILALLWDRLLPGGCLFIDATPYRYNIVETHTTGLPLINFLPDWLTHWAANRFSKRLGRNESWPTLLRKGIRGGTAAGILKRLRKTGQGEPVLLPVRAPGQKDAIDLWYHRSQAVRKAPFKKVAYLCFKTVYAVTGIVSTPDLTIAIRKS